IIADIIGAENIRKFGKSLHPLVSSQNILTRIKDMWRWYILLHKYNIYRMMNLDRYIDTNNPNALAGIVIIIFSKLTNRVFNNALNLKTIEKSIHEIEVSVRKSRLFYLFAFLYLIFCLGFTLIIILVLIRNSPDKEESFLTSYPYYILYTIVGLI